MLKTHTYIRTYVYLITFTDKLIKQLNMSTYSYKNPKFINSPKGLVEVVEVIYDGQTDPAYSLAVIKWEGDYKLGIRWNIAYSEWGDYRKENGKFKSVEEIKEVSGIGDSKFEQIKDLIEI